MPKYTVLKISPLGTEMQLLTIYKITCAKQHHSRSEGWYNIGPSKFGVSCSEGRWVDDEAPAFCRHPNKSGDRRQLRLQSRTHKLEHQGDGTTFGVLHYPRRYTMQDVGSYGEQESSAGDVSQRSTSGVG